MTKKTNHNGRKRPKKLPKLREKAQYLRIAQVSFQARLDASSGTTTAGSESRQIQNKN